MTLSVTINSSIVGTTTGVSGLLNGTGTVNDSDIVALTDGTGTGQADGIFSTAPGINGGDTHEYLMSSGLVDLFGEALDFTAVKSILVKAAKTNVSDIVVGGGSFAGPVAGLINVAPGTKFLMTRNDATGWPLDPTTDQLLITSASAGAYSLTLVGVSSVISKPAWSVKPFFNAQPKVGVVTSINDGVFSGNPDLSYEFRVNGAVVSTGQATYTPVSADVGKRLERRTIGSNIGGVVSASTLPTIILSASGTLQIILGGPLAYTAGVAQGSEIASVANVPAGVTPTVIAPTDGSMVISGSQAAGWNVVVGSVTSSPGNKTLTVGAAGATQATATVVVSGAVTAPPAPTLGALVIGDGQLTLNWTDNGTGGSPLTNHKVWEGASGAETLLTTLGGNVTTYTDTGLTDGVSRSYKVSAGNVVNDSILSNEKTGAPTAAVPTLTNSGVLAFTTTTPPNTQIGQINNVPAGVTPSISPNDGRLILGTLTGSSWPILVGPTASGVSTINLVASASGANPSATTPINVTLSTSVPAAPTLLAIATGNGQLTLNWTDNGTGGSPITAHKVYGGFSSGNEVLIGTVTSGSTFTDILLTNGQQRFYEVTAVNDTNGEGPRSNERSGTPSGTVQTANQMMLAALPAKPLVAELGGSRERQNAIGVSTGAGQIRQMSSGQLMWAELMNPTVFHTSVNYSVAADDNSNAMAGMLFANDGESFVQAYQRIPALLASDAQLVVCALSSNSLQDDDFDIYGNDLGVPASVLGYTAPYKQMLLTIINGGKPVIVKNLWERDHTVGGNWAIFPNSPRYLVPGINTEMQNFCTQYGIPYMDVRSTMSDPNNNYDPFPQYCRELTGKTHLSTIGGYTMGTIYAATLASVCTAGADHDEAAAGNLAPNPTLTGTTGTQDGNFSVGSVIPTGWTISGTPDGATVSTAKITKNGRTWLEFTIDTTTMTDTTSRGIVKAALAITGLTVGQFYEHFARFEVDAYAEWAGCFFTNFLFSDTVSYGMCPLNSGGSYVGASDPTALPGPSVAYSGIIHGMPLKASATSASLSLVTPGFSKGGIVKVRVTAPELRQVADPGLLMYNEANTTVPTITSPTTYTFPENFTFTIPSVGANNTGRWSLSGADITGTLNGVAGSKLFTISKYGDITWTSATPPDYDNPSDSNSGSDNVYNLTRTYTPQNPAVAATSQNFTVTITDVNDGFTDLFNVPSTGDLSTRTGWTASPNYVTGAFTVSGGRLNSNSSLAAGGVFAPAQGHTVDQQVSAVIVSNSSSWPICVRLLDENNWLGIQVSAGVLQIKKHIAGVSTVLLAISTTSALPNRLYKAIANDRITAQVLNGVFNVYQNGVLVGTFNVAGILDGTGAGTQATPVYLSGMISGSSAPMDSWTNVTASAIVSKIALNALTLATGGLTTETIAAGAFFGDNVVGYTGTPNMAVTSDPSNLFFMDGITLRTSAPLPSGTYPVSVTETNADAANNNKVSAFIITAS